MVRLINAVRRRFGVSLSVPELFKNPTVEQVATLIVAHQPTSEHQPRVIQLQEGKAQTPIYFIYAGPDEFRLAQLTSGAHPVFGIEIPWPLAWRTAAANGQTSALPNMEQLVAPYVSLLRAHVNSSPCILAGYSFGGMMAFEAAHQFQRLGGKVEMVILYDSWAKSPTPYEIALHSWRQDQRRTAKGLLKPWVSVGLHLKNSWLMTSWLFDMVMAMKRARSHLNRRIRGQDMSYHFDEKDIILSWELVTRLYAAARSSYHLRPLDSRGILFQPADREHARSVDRSQGWKDVFARGLEIIPVVGTHLSMVREASNNLSLRQQIEEVLNRHRQDQSEVDVDAR